MPDLKYGQLFKALFIAGALGYLTVAFWGIWVGIPVFMASGWLFYEFRYKLKILRQVLKQELPNNCKIIGEIIGEMIADAWRSCFWKNDQIRITIFVISVIALLLEAVIIYIRFEKYEGILVLVFAVWMLFWLLLDGSAEMTDKKIGIGIIKSPWLFLVFLCKCFKFIIKVFILSIYRIHSKELVASSIYALVGMFYVVIFPPFTLELTQQMLFLMAIGCGLFTGACGCLIHKVLSTAVAQLVFAKIEAW